ncbi:MAG: exonuclease SbcCD subunit D [Dehalococcoidales bacterium]|nr:exonuclease SbcCD subunit D [Dehalococcoidales bacterium]
MSKIRLLHLADIHLGIEKYGRVDPATGLNSRLVDFCSCLDEAIEFALGNDVDLVVFCGDAYRSRDPNPTYQREFARRIRKLARSGIQVFLLVGNHDLPLATGRANSVEIFETLEVDNVHIGRKPGLHLIRTRRGPVQIVAMPWLARNVVLSRDDHKNKTLDEINQLIEEYVATRIGALAEELDERTPAILAAHLSVLGAVYGSEKSVMLGSDLLVPRSAIAKRAFDYVALGHVHKHQVVSNDPLAIYAGSIERVDFGEEGEEKGFVVVDLEKGSAEYSFRTVRARRFLTIEVNVEVGDPTEQIITAIERHHIEGSVVRIQIRTTPEKEPAIQYTEIRRALKDAHSVAAISKHVERKARTAFSGHLVEDMTPRQALDLYLRAKQYPTDRARLLLEYADRLLQDGTQASARLASGSAPERGEAQ